MKRKETVKTFEQLEAFMNWQLDPTSTVEDWNARREEAKERFSPELIGQLDASGFIKNFNLKPA